MDFSLEEAPKRRKSLHFESAKSKRIENILMAFCNKPRKLEEKVYDFFLEFLS